MSEAPISGGAAPSVPGGNEPTPGGSNPPDDRVAKADHERALNDMHKFKESARVAAADAAAAKARVEELNQKLSLQNKDYEGLFTQEKEKRVAVEKEKDELKKSVVYAERYRAAYPKLKAAGLRDDAENLIEVMDFNTIEIEATSNGRFICNGVEAFIEAQKVKFPYAFQNPNAPIVNGASGGGAPGTPQQWTAESLYQLEQQCKVKRDMAPYYAAVGEYKKQRRA